MPRASTLEPKQRILAHLDGALVPCSVVAVDSDDGRLDLDLRLDSGQRHHRANPAQRDC